MATPEAESRHGWLIVTPAHDEAQNLAYCARALMAQDSRQIRAWVIVDDGSTDATGDIARSLEVDFPKYVIETRNSGGLIGGSAFRAWQSGVDWALGRGLHPSWLMKLDADVELSENYLRLISQALSHFDCAGGLLEGPGHQERLWHVPGPAKAYSWRGYTCLTHLPRSVGFDVIDELSIRDAGYLTTTIGQAKIRIRRAIGASQGRIHGRYRNGVVCRWTGYWWPYLLLHSLRYCFRRPRLVGGAAVVYGYLLAGHGPYPSELRARHRREQRQRLLAAVGLKVMTGRVSSVR